MPQKFNIALFLTWIRIAAIPMVVIVFMLPAYWAKPTAAVIFTIAGLTDWLDGYLARKLNLTSRFDMILAVCAAIIIGREIVISALREWMAEVGERSTVAVTGIAKMKTIFQLVGVGAMLFTYPIFGILPAYGIGFVLVVAASVLTVWSMYLYLIAAWPTLMAPEDRS